MAMPELSQRQTPHQMSGTLRRTCISAQQQRRQATFQLHTHSYLPQSLDNVIDIPDPRKTG
jgi:hypothetical protein